MRTIVVNGGGKFQVGRSCGYRFQTHSRQGFNLQSETVQAEITRLLGGIPKLNAIMLTGEPRLSCAICEIRKEKRFCPAVHGRICPQCCGEQREVTLDCPSECPYLQQAREHEKPRPAEQFDAASLFLQVEISEQFTYEREHLLMGLSYALAKAAHADRSLNDRDLIAALSAMCTRQERLVNSGLHYDEPLASGAQHAVAAQVEEMLNQFREAEQKQLGHTTLRDSDVLKALAFLV